MSVQLQACPKCGNWHGWYEKRIHTGDQYYEANGEASHYNDTNTRGGVRKYCWCGWDITKLIGEQKGGGDV